MTDTGFTINSDVTEDKVNNKKAGIAMCLSSVLLFLFPLCSGLDILMLEFLTSTCLPFVKNGIVKLLVLAGKEKIQAVSVVKYLFSSNAYFVLFEMILSLLSLVLPAYIFSKFVKMDSNSTFPWQGKFVKGFFRVYCAIQVIVLFAGIFSTDLFEFLIPQSKIHPGGFTDYSQIGFDGYFLAMRIIQICIFVPIAEEYVFRGVIFGYLKKHGVMYGVFASAAIFGIAHSSPAQSVYAFVFGLFSAFLVACTGSIKTSVVFHAMNNAISIINEYLIAYASDNIVYVFNSAFNVIQLFVGFAGLYLLAKKDGLCDSFRQKCVQADDAGMQESGMRQIFVLPVAVYVVAYGVKIFLTAV